MHNLVDEESDGKSDGGSNSSKVKIAAVVLSVRSNLQFNYKIFCRYAYQKLDHMSIDVCIDLLPKKELNFGGHDVSEYCKTIDDIIFIADRGE